jgi:hypothetical protein
MRHVIAVAALISIPAGIPMAQDAEWRPFTAEGFGVEWPGQPTVSEDPMRVPYVDAVRHYTLDRREGGGYRVTVFHPQPGTGSAGYGMALDFAIGVFLHACSVLTQGEVETAIGKVRDITTMCSGRPFRARFFRGGDNLYQAAVSGFDGFEKGPEAARFLDSFHLEQPGWKPLTADVDAFEAAFPWTPVIREGKFDPETYVAIPTYLVYHGGGLLRVSVVHFRPEVRERTSDEEVFSYSLQTVTAECEIGGTADLGLPTGPAREVDAICPPGDLHYRIQHHVVGDRLYEVAAAGSAEFVKGADAEAFFAAFHPIAPQASR